MRVMGRISFVVFLMSLTLSVCSTRFPRELPEIGEPKLFKWGQKLVLHMSNNGTVQLKRAQQHNCTECEVQLRSLCEISRKSVVGCPKKRLGKGVQIAATLMVMHFNSAGKYLCLHQNNTFYAVASLGNNIEECAFFVVQEGPNATYVSIYHYKYPHKKRNCRLKERRDNATNRCHKFYLRKGSRRSLSVTKLKSFKESRWHLTDTKI